jgi:amidophosphoribosyltransferase
VNYAELKTLLFEKYHRLLNSDNDVESILNVFAQELAHQKTRELRPEHIFKAVRGVYSKVIGSYSVVAYIAEQGLVAFRDPFGIKPLVWGVRRDGIIPSFAVGSGLLQP